MTLVSRGVTLFILILLLLLSFLGIHEYREAKREEKLRVSLENNYQYNFDKFLKIKKAPVKKYLQDITIWDASVRFMKDRNRRYTVENIDMSGGIYGIGETWIYTADFKKIYYFSNSKIKTKAADIDPVIPLVTERFSGGGFFSFYYRKDNNLFEITAVSIHPTNDIERKTRPAGYIFTAIPYDRDFTDQLKSDMPVIAEIKIDFNSGTPPYNPEMVAVALPLNDIKWTPVAYFQVLFFSQYLRDLDSGDRIKNFFILFFIVIFILIATAFWHGIIIPIRELYKILYDHSYSPHPDKFKFVSPEFQSIANLIKLNRNVEVKLGEALREAETQKSIAEKATNAKTEFLANMSHEIRTPMTGVLGFADMLLDSTVDPVNKELASGIKTSAETVMDIINDILDISKIESGKFILIEEPFSINGFLENFIWILKGFAAERKVDLILENKIGSNITLYGDEKRLKQILMNLGSNAVKFTTEGGVHITAEASPCDDNKIEVTFTVSDTGIGMNEEQLSKLYRQYEQVHDHTLFSGGTGLGLAITKSLVDAMNGTIDIKSRPGEGTTFTVRIKMKYSEGEAPKPSLISARDLNLEVLIAEDNLISMKVIGNIVSKAGCRYIPAYNGREAINLAGSKKYDLILMDFHMPVTNGIDAALVIRKAGGLNSNTPIYGISADILEKAKENTEKSGIDGFIKKPFKIEEVFRVLLSVKGRGHDIA